MDKLLLQHKLNTTVWKLKLVSKMSQIKKKSSKVRAPSGLLVSLSSITGVIGVVFIVGLAIYSDNLIVSAFLVVVFIIPAAKRFIRGKSKRPLREQGEGTSDNYFVGNGVVD